MSNSQPRALPPVHPIWTPVKPERLKSAPFSGQAEAETIIIGGGIAGILTAWRLAEAGKRPVLLEEGELLNGDTGYTTSFVTRVPDASVKGWIDTFGLEKCKRVWETAKAAQAWLRETVRREKIDCDWVDCDAFVVSYEKDDPKLLEEFQAMQQLDSDVTMVTPETDSRLPQGAVAAIRISGEAHMHIRKFIFGLLARPAAKKIKFYEDTKVTKIELGPSAVRITSAEGFIDAQQVFVATGWPSLLPTLSEKVLSYTTYVVAAEYDQFPITTDIFWDTADPYHYFRRVNEKTMLLGGGDRKIGDRVDQEMPHRELIDFLERRLPGFKKITHRWSGSIHQTPDELPTIGWMPGTKRIGVGTGWSGCGMVFGSVTGMLLGDLALGKHPAAEEILSPSRLSIPPMSVSAQVAETTQAPWWRPVLRAVLPFIPLIVLWYVGYTFFAPRGGLEVLNGLNFKSATLVIFPLFGLIAFTLVWIQLMIGSLMPLLRRVYLRIERFHRVEGVFVLLFATLHPLWLTIGLGLDRMFKRDYVADEQKIYIYFAYTALGLMYITVATALLSRAKWLQKWWRKIHLFNYVIFYSAWIHSWNLGSDVQSTGLRIVWWVYGLTVTGALIRRLVARRRPAAIESEAKASENFVKIASLEQVQPDKPFCGTVNGKQIALFNIEGKIYALDNVCNHAEGPLCEGFMDGKFVECPLHASRFDVTTGAVMEGPATQAQPTFKVRIQGSDVEVAA